MNPLSPSAEKARCKGSLPMMMRVFSSLFMCEGPIVGKALGRKVLEEKEKNTWSLVIMSRLYSIA